MVAQRREFTACSSLSVIRYDVSVGQALPQRDGHSAVARSTLKKPGEVWIQAVILAVTPTSQADHARRLLRIAIV